MRVGILVAPANVRSEVPNTSGELRLGTYADVVVAGASGVSTSRVPRNAVQNVGDRTVVYLANPKEPGKFIEREVRLGRSSGGQVEVMMPTPDGPWPCRADDIPEARRVAAPSRTTHRRTRSAYVASCLPSNAGNRIVHSLAAFKMRD